MAQSIPQSAPLLADDPQPDVALQPGNDIVSLMERFSSQPGASVETLERMMSLWERNEERRAKAAFNASMNRAQNEMRAVVADSYNSQTSSRYASYEALDADIRPIYTKHGFALSFDSGDSEKPDHVLVLCYVTHTGGHDRTYKLDMPADGKGAKGGDVMTKTHATGSGVSYGQRYLLKMIFNVAIKGDDDDGNRAGGGQRQQRGQKAAPVGYELWAESFEACADEGPQKLDAMWKSSKDEFRKYIASAEPKRLASIRTKASKVRA